MDRINQDTSHTNSVDGKFILADLITSTAFSNVSGDFNTYSSSYVEYEVGIENQLYNAEIRLNEPSASSTFENTWGNVYTSLKNARVIIGQCQEGKRDEGNLVTRGIAEVMEAYNGALLADIFGDTPYSEASLLDENGSPVNMNPKIDKQEEIYVSIMASLDKAIEDLNQSDRSPVGTYDYLYNGDAEKWIKFAYGLKARYTMRLINRSTDKQADLNKVLDYVSKSFTSADDEAAYAVYDANNINPFFGYFDSRAGFANSQSLTDKLIDSLESQNGAWVELQQFKQFVPVVFHDSSRNHNHHCSQRNHFSNRHSIVHIGICVTSQLILFTSKKEFCC